MKTNTVNISFREDLLTSIDKLAHEESRSRSELIREAARMYIEKKQRWGLLFKSGEQLAAINSISEDDVLNELTAHRLGH